jgi:hypothetical protein
MRGLSNMFVLTSLTFLCFHSYLLNDLSFFFIICLEFKHSGWSKPLFLGDLTHDLNNQYNCLLPLFPFQKLLCRKCRALDSH